MSNGTRTNVGYFEDLSGYLPSSASIPFHLGGASERKYSQPRIIYGHLGQARVFTSARVLSQTSVTAYSEYEYEIENSEYVY